MPRDVVCKTVHQYSKGKIAGEDMAKLQEIAEDYGRVRNEVYKRFGGIGGLGKIYPGYTVQKEMAESGLREKLELPSVYFNLAVFDALGDVKGQWARTKAEVLRRVNRNEGFSEEEKHFLRFVLKMGNFFEAVLNRKTIDKTGIGTADGKGIKEEVLKRYGELAGNVDVKNE